MEPQNWVAVKELKLRQGLGFRATIIWEHSNEGFLIIVS